MVFVISNRSNAMLSQLATVAVTTYLGEGKVVTEKVVLVFVDFFRNHNTLNDFVNFGEIRRNSTTLLLMGNESGIFLGRVMAPKEKIVTILLSLPHFPISIENDECFYRNLIKVHLRILTDLDFIVGINYHG